MTHENDTTNSTDEITVKRGVKCPQNRDGESLRNRERKVHFFAVKVTRDSVIVRAPKPAKA